MGDRDRRSRTCLTAALVGAIGGGLIVALATRAIPKIVSGIMSEMVQNMMSEMGEGGCDPAQL